MKNGEPPLSQTPPSREGTKPTPSLYQPSAFIQGWMLLPLRLFLGVTFLYAGVQKLTDPDYFRPQAIGYVGNQLATFANGSPLSAFLLRIVAPHATLFGACVAYGEVAIGIGTLLGLLLRPAAFFGVLLNLIFFLSASWRVYPYFYGSDIVFIFAWITLLLAGPLRSGLPTLDGLFAPRFLDTLPPAAQVRIGQLTSFFLGINNASGPQLAQLESGKNLQDIILDKQELAMGNSAVQEAPQRLPQQVNSHGDMAAQRDALASRRTFLWGLLAGGLGMLGITLAERMLHVGSFVGDDSGASAQPAAHTTSTSGSAYSTTTPGPSSSAATIVQASAVPINSAISFTLPSNGDYGLLIHLNSDKFVCFDANCTHAGCPVAFDPGSSLLICPCHGAVFDPAHNAKVLRGPARTPLTNVPIKVNKATGAITLQ